MTVKKPMPNQIAARSHAGRSGRFGSSRSSNSRSMVDFNIYRHRKEMLAAFRIPRC